MALGALGGGGSILAVPVLVFVAGATPAEATSTSLVVVGIASLIGAYGHWRSGRVRLAAGLGFGIVGVGGSVAGSALNRRIDGDLLLLGFAGLLLVAAWRIVVGCPSCTRTGEAWAVAEPPVPGGGVAVRIGLAKRALQVVAAGTGVGFLTGLFGVGGGFVIVPTLALVLRFSMPAAVGTSLVVIATNSAAALAARLGTGLVEWAPTMLFAAAAVAGVVAGGRVADRLDPRSMQRAFAVLLVALALYTGATSIFSGVGR